MNNIDDSEVDQSSLIETVSKYLLCFLQILEKQMIPQISQCPLAVNCQLEVAYFLDQ